MDWTVRQAGADDAPALLELWHGFTDHLSEYDERYTHKESADDRWLDYFEGQLLDSKYGTVFVAINEDTGDPIGVLEARVMGNHPIFRLENHGYIKGHFVPEQYQGHGIGQALLEAAHEWFTEPPREVDFYRVDVIDGDGAAAAFYEDADFVPVEHTWERRVD